MLFLEGVYVDSANGTSPRFRWVKAPNSTHRAQVTPAKRGKGHKVRTTDLPEDTPPVERRVAMTWAQRLLTRRLRLHVAR